MASYPFPNRTGLRASFGTAVLFLSAFSLLPAAAIFVMSFTDIRNVLGVPTHWIGLYNYRLFFSAAERDYNLTALKHTLAYTVVVTVAANVIALAFAVVLNRNVRGRSLYRAIVFLPTVLGVTVVGLIWTLMLNPDGGPGASILSWFGSSSAFFGDPKIALGLVVLVQVWMGLGVNMIIYLSGLQAIPSELYEVASIDGSSAWQRFRHVTFPLLAPARTASVALSIVGSFGSYQL